MERKCEVLLYNLGPEAGPEEPHPCGREATWTAIGRITIDTCDLHLGALPKEVWTVGSI